MNADNILVNLSGTQVANWFAGSHAVNISLLVGLANGSVFVPISTDSTGAIRVI